jgi:uncharacterized protein YggE
MRKGIYLLILMIGIGCSATAQTTDNENGTINISMNATEYLPADRIVFNINLNAEERTPRSAYQKHKEQEVLLASLLQEFEIDDENIQFQPIRIDKMYRNNQRDQYSRTNQQVSVTFDDFDIYEEIQVTLIENNFDSFSGTFSSSKMEEGKEAALLSAIEAAKERAQLIAEASNLELGDAYSINYSEHTTNYPPMVMESRALMIADSAPSLMDFEQVVSVSANISIQFRIRD